MAKNRRLSKFAPASKLDFIDDTIVDVISFVSDSPRNIGIGISDGTTSKLTVDGGFLSLNSFEGNLSGNLEGNVTGDLVGNVTGIITGDIYGTVYGDIVGFASTAYLLASNRTFSIDCPDLLTTPVLFNGGADVGFAVTLTNTGVSSGSYGQLNANQLTYEVAGFTVDANGRMTAVSDNPISTGMTVAADTGPDQTVLFTIDTLTIAGDNNLTSIATTDTITVNLNPDISLTEIKSTFGVGAPTLSTGNLSLDGPVISSGSTVTFSTNDLYVLGNLEVDGTITSLGSTSVSLTQKNVVVAKGSANDNDAQPGGFTVESIAGGNKTFEWINVQFVPPSTFIPYKSFVSSENLNLVSGKSYYYNGNQILSSTTLGAGVTLSSLQKVGELNYLNVKGTVTSGSFDGSVIGNVSTASSMETARNFSISGDAVTATPTSFDGTADVGIAFTLATSGVTTGTYGSPDNIPVLTVNSKGLITGIANTGFAPLLNVAGDVGGVQPIELAVDKLSIKGRDNLETSTGTDTVTVGLTSNISLSNINITGIITNSIGRIDSNLVGNVYAGSGFSTTGISTFNDIQTTFITDNFGNPGIGTTTNKVLGKLGFGVTWVDYYDNDSTVQLGTGLFVQEQLDVPVSGIRTTAEYSVQEGQTTFTFNHDTNYLQFLDVYVNGVKWGTNQWTSINQTQITLTDPIFTNDIVQFVQYDQFAYKNRYVKSLNDLGNVGITTDLANGNGYLLRAVDNVPESFANHTGYKLVGTVSTSRNIAFHNNSLTFSTTDVDGTSQGIQTYTGRGGRLSFESTSGFFDSRVQIISNYIGVTTYSTPYGVGNEGLLILGKTRGTTLGSNTTIQRGDIIGKVFFKGSDGTGLKDSAIIQVEANQEPEITGSVGSGAMPGTIRFQTSPGGTSQPVDALKIDANGRIRVGLGLTVPPYEASLPTDRPGTWIGGLLSDTSLEPVGTVSNLQNGDNGIAVNSNNIVVIVHKTFKALYDPSSTVGFNGYDINATPGQPGYWRENIRVPLIALGNYIGGTGGVPDALIPTGGITFGKNSNYSIGAASTTTDPAPGASTVLGLWYTTKTRELDNDFLPRGFSEDLNLARTAALTMVYYDQNNGAGANPDDSVIIVPGIPKLEDIPWGRSLFQQDGYWFNRSRLILNSAAPWPAVPNRNYYIPFDFYMDDPTQTTRSQIIDTAKQAYESDTAINGIPYDDWFRNKNRDFNKAYSEWLLTNKQLYYVTGSDYRLKENISVMTDSTERFMKLNPCNYNFKGSDNKQDGFLAHELQEVIPKAVTGEKDEVYPNGDPKYQAVGYREVIPLLTSALKETLERLESLDSRVAALS